MKDSIDIIKGLNIDLSKWNSNSGLTKLKNLTGEIVTPDAIEIALLKKGIEFKNEEKIQAFISILELIKKEEAAKKDDTIGSMDILDGFFEHVRVDDSLNCYITKEFPLKNYHMNILYNEAYNDKKGGAPISMADLPIMVDTYKSWYCNVFNKEMQYQLDMRRAIDEYLTNKANINLNILMKKLEYNPQEIDYLKILVEEIIADETLWESYYNIIKHWMWCVKRRSLSLSTIYQQLLVFTGAQGTGKTYMINKFISVFKEHTLMDAKVSQIAEERSAAIDSTKLIWVLDEMPFADKTNMDKLKSWVTSEESIYRPMGTNSSVGVKKRSMGIGSQNNSLGNVLQDNTGNRRFVDIPVKQTMNEYIDVFKKEHEYNKDFQSDVAWISMWTNVDENKERGYIDLEIADKGVQKILNSNFTATTEYTFFTSVFIGTETIKMRRSFLYECYKLYVKNVSGNKPKANNKFIIDFKSMCESLNLKYSETSYANVQYVNIPQISDDYKELFRTIPQTIPAIFKNNQHFFEDNKIYVSDIEHHIEFNKDTKKKGYTFL